MQISLNFFFLKIFKFVIVHFGSYAFACHWLTLEQWAWCFLFGFGTLIWGQVNNFCNLKFNLKLNLETFLNYS